ncbi:immunoglobulin superfamily member 10 isoform X1 [Haemorhous mexicanus]|uniref:immunoglobulin superfamily member 10 isoform X1 n=1 Tax=Haemorhous mexicanus TaxID=30427 RepID=UPI0028BF4238|nr:immunoglobulin superfamily member 10 isoform X1 [Haemorhous mexicanus]
MGAPRGERPRWLGTLLAACLATRLATLPAISACPRPCACHGSAELHCTFRYFTAVPPRIPPDVQRINLGYNSLRKLSPTDFAGLEKLELLMLHSNEISTIPEKVFRDLHSLQVLKMSYNKVRVLQQDVFYGLNSLVRLHMDHNQIEFVNPNVFYGLTSLRLVHLDGNLLQQLHPDTFVTLRYSQIFRISFLKHISLSDNVLTSLPQEMFSYMSELESLYLHGNPWSCDCSLQGFAGWAQERPDVIKCRKERSSGVQQCPVCASPKNHNGKSLVDLPSASFTCTKPVIQDSLKSRNLSVPDDGDFSFVSPKDLMAPIGSVVLNMTDQAGNRGNLVCNVQRPKEMSPISFDQDGPSRVLKASLSAFLVCGIDHGHIQQLWSILALYSSSPLKLEQTVRAADEPFVSYSYRQAYSENDELFTRIEAELRAEPAWLMQSQVSLQLDRTATTLSTLHLRYTTQARVALPSHDRDQGRHGWAIIARDNSTQREHTVLVGGTVELGCQAAGQPAPAVEWVLADGSKVRAPHISEDGRILVLRSGVLTLRTADVFDSGLYHCTSTNHQDADVLTFRITVVDPHVEHNGVNGAQLPAALGSTLHLPCTATAAPDPAVTWVLPEHTILRQSAGNKHIFANGTLRIQGVTQRDVGYFRCVAANRYGVDLLVFQVLVGQDETALKEKHGALGDWEEGSGNELLRSAAAQRHPSGTAATLRALGEPAAPAASSQGAQSQRQRSSHRKMPHWPYADRAGRRFRGHRRQFVPSGRRADPQRWAALLEKTKRNSTVTDKRGEAATEPPIQVRKLSELPEGEEETSGDLVSPEEEFMIPATERSPVSALGRATELMITAGPKESADPPPAWNSSLLPTEPLTPLPSPLPHSGAPASKRLQTLPKPTASWERSDLSQISANGVKQPTVPSGTATLFPAGQKSIYSGESNNQHLKSVSMTPTTEATGISKAVTPQNTADKLYNLAESIDNVSTKTDHQVPVTTVSAPSSEFSPIYFHSTQKGGAPNPPLASTFATHQQIQVIQDVPTHPAQLQQHYGRRRKISGRRRIVRPGRVPGMKEPQYNFGRPGSARGSAAVATGIQLNMNYASNVPALNNSSSSINPFSPETSQSSPSTTKMPLEHPVDTPHNTAFLGEEEKKHGARQKAAATVVSVTAEDTATAAASGLGVTDLKPTVPLVITPQMDTRATKSKILRVGGRRGQRRKRPPKTPAPQRVAAAQSTAGTSAVSTAATPAAQSTAATPAASMAATPAAQSMAATHAAQSTAATPAGRSTAATPAVSTAATPAATPAGTPMVTAPTSPVVPPGLAPANPLPGSSSALSRTKAAALGVPDTPEAPQHRPMADTQTAAAPGTWRSTPSARPLAGSVTAQSPPMAPQTTPDWQRNTQLATSPAASPAQTPSMALQTSPWLDEPPGATSAPPAAVSATPGPGRAQHTRASAREKPSLDLGEGAVPEEQGAQPAAPARAVPSAPTAPSSQHPSPLPAPTAALPADPPRAPSPPRGHGQLQLQPRPPPEGTERGNALQAPPIAPPRGGDKDSSVSAWSGRRQDQDTSTLPSPSTLASASRKHFSKPRIVGGKVAAFTLQANSDAFIPCEATGNPPPAIHWTKIPPGRGAAGRWSVLPNGTLAIARAGPQDGGQYLCTAANALGSARLLVTLAVRANPPRIAGRGRPLTAHSGSSAALPCRAEGSPPPRISWLLANGTELGPGSAGGGRARVEPDGTLLIRAVTVYDRGTYTCLARNAAGTDTLPLRLQVVAAPPTIVEEKRQSVAGTAGESLSLPCTVRGKPEPSVHWVLPAGAVLKPLQGLHARLLLLANGTLHLGSIAPSDSGTYECIATSSTGSDRRVVSLVVQRRETPPKIAIASQELTRLNFGERLLLNCTASGDPKPRIIWRLPSKALVDQWHRMGSRIHVYPNGSLAIEAVTEKDAGDYLCVARNSIGDDLILMKVSIAMKPAKIDHKQQFKKLVPYGKDFRVDCKASGSPTPAISWGLPDGTVVNSAMQADDSGHRARRYVLFHNGTLYLNKAGVAEGGDYTCYAQNTLGRDEMKIHVTVIVAAPQIKHNHKTHITVTAGDAALLDCEAAGEPRAQIFWLLPSSERISSSTDRHSLHTNGSLSISQAGLLDAGEYLCVARNPGGDDSKLYKLDVAAKPPIINGLHRNKTIMKVTAVRHSKKHIDCRAEGTPPPQIMWIMPDNIFLTAPYYGSRIVVHKNGTLEIRNIRPSDTGDFICVARNDGGETVLVVQLEVTEMLRRPMFKNPFNEKIIAKPGKTITLNCSVDGNPPPDISWMLPNGTWFSSSIRTAQFSTGSNGTLTLHSPESQHAGRYRCAARNQVGYIEKLMVLEVAQKPKILTRPAGLVRGVSGEPLSLHCLAEGSPRPRLAWTLPGGRVLERPQLSGRLLLLDNGTLVIGAASAHDAGNYLCRAHNDAGDSSLTIPVVVAAYAPRIMGRPPPAIHTLPGAAVQLHCVVLGIPKPEITWELPDHSVLSTAHQGRGSGGELLHPTGTLLLQNPRPSSSGTYRCTARNPLGTDTAATYVHVI